eukprot:g14181.t1
MFESVDAFESVGDNSGVELKKPAQSGASTKRAALALLTAASAFGGALHLYRGHRGAKIHDSNFNSPKVVTDDAVGASTGGARGSPVATDFLETGTASSPRSYRYVSCGKHDKNNFGKPDVADNVSRLLAQLDPASNGGIDMKRLAWNWAQQSYEKRTNATLDWAPTENCNLTRSNDDGGYVFKPADKSKEGGTCQENSWQPYMLHSKSRPGGPELLYSDAEQRARGQSCFPEGAIQYLQAFDVGILPCACGHGGTTHAFLCMTDHDTDDTPKALLYKAYSDNNPRYCDDVGRPTWAVGKDVTFGHLDGIPNAPTYLLSLARSGEEEGEEEKTGKTEAKEKRTTREPDVAENVNRLFAITKGELEWSDCKLEPRKDLGGDKTRWD